MINGILLFFIFATLLSLLYISFLVVQTLTEIKDSINNVNDNLINYTNIKRGYTNEEGKKMAGAITD
ncbi:MAG: hypothetical protein ACOCP8_01780 [archaeon]